MTDESHAGKRHQANRTRPLTIIRLVLLHFSERIGYRNSELGVGGDGRRRVRLK